MLDDNGTETVRSDAPRADDALFGDAADKADDTDAVPAEEKDTGENAEQDEQGAADTENKSDAEEATATAEELKVVVSIKGGRAVIGVQQPSSDPHIESFDGHDLPALAQEVTAVTERAKAKWEESPTHPAYEKPAPSARRQRRRQPEAAQEATTETEAEQTQQQTLNLF